MRRWIVSVSASLILATTVAESKPLPGGTPESVGMSSKRLDRIAPIMQEYVDDGHVSGISTAVARRGKIVHVASVGMRDIERKLPMTRDTIFRIHSMTKPITSVAVMILYEEGRFPLTDPVSKYLPQFEKTQVYVSGTTDSLQLEAPENGPTIQDLLRHTAGLGGGQTVVDSLFRAADLRNRELTLHQVVERLGTVPLNHQPGTQFLYGMSTDVLGFLVQVVSGQPVEVFLEERIFSPLDMVDTGFYVPANKLDRFAHNYKWTDDETLERIDEGEPPRYTVPPKSPSGGGGLVSTVDDYLRFCQMIVNEGELDGERILMPATVRYMLLDHLDPEQTVFDLPFGFGLGFGILRDPVRFGHVSNVGQAAWGGAANTFFWIEPDEELISIAWTQLMPFGTRDFYKKMYPLVHAARLD